MKNWHLLKLKLFLIVSLPILGAQASVITTSCFSTTSCTMAELFAGGSITINDKVFDDFALDVTAPFSIIPDFNNVIVTGLDDGGLSPGPGLSVDGGGEFVATGGNEVAFEYSFNVNVTDPLLRISDTSVSVASGAFDVMTEGRWEVEQRIAAGGSGLGTNFTFADGFFASQTLSDSLLFAPQTSIDVINAVFVGDFLGGETISLDGYTQRFSQTIVPLPAAVWLFVSGLIGMISIGVKRHQ